jgi:hypothetical protein
MLNDFIERKRRPTERLSTFVSRFRELASTHMMHTQALQDSQLVQMPVILLINNSTLDANSFTSKKLEIIRYAEFRVLEENRTANYSPCNQSRRRMETMKPFIIKI